jgi:2-iminoacetate synthase
MAEIMDRVIKTVSDFSLLSVSEGDVDKVLKKEIKEPFDLGVLLSPAAGNRLGEMALLAAKETKRYFGRNIWLYTPMYIANFCINECLYCGYSRNNEIHRARLSLEEIEAEAKIIAQTGLTDILLLTGESRQHSDVAYIGEAVEILSRYFSSVGLEVYPVRSEEYSFLRQKGADFVSVYQETYNQELYKKVHPGGPKKNYQWRFSTQERALMGGFRGVAFGALLGLGDWRENVLACGAHAYYVQKKYPTAEISFSTPRIRPVPNRSELISDVSEIELLQVIMALRLFMPWVSLSLSTRERADFRDSCVGLGVNRLSAGVCTSVGGHSGEKKGDEQFFKADERGVDEVCSAIVSKGCQPVFNDYVRV